MHVIAGWAWILIMVILMEQPDVDGLTRAVGALREWQQDGPAMQLHSGDVGWFWRFGAERTAAAVRIWSRGGELLAMGLLDGADLIRMAFAPEAGHDAELADRLAADLVNPDRGVLPSGKVSIEAPLDARIQDLLLDAGWVTDGPWTQLRYDFSGSVPDPGIRVVTVGPAQVADRAAVQRAAFNSRFSEEQWHAMASGPLYDEARCLLAYDDNDDPVSCITVWSAGEGRPGLIEPMGAHPDHRGKGYGKAIALAGVNALREMGASSATVCTYPGGFPAAVPAYKAAGFQVLGEVRDLRRDA